MSGSLNTFGNNVVASFDNLSHAQFRILYEEVLKERARRLLGKEVLNDCTHAGYRHINLNINLSCFHGRVEIFKSSYEISP